MQKNYEILTGHTIICGYGRNGKQTVKELMSHNHKVLVIEKNEAAINEIRTFPEVYYLIGDATADDVMKAAYVSQASAMITTLPNDADNLFVVLTARIHNERMPIVSRASERKICKKLSAAGANEVIMPDMLGGQRMAQLVLEPDIVEFVDYILLQDADQVNLEELSVKYLDRSFINKSIRELNIRNVSGANIIGLKTYNDKYVLNPPSDFQLEQASHIFALGKPEQISKLKELITKGE